MNIYYKTIILTIACVLPGLPAQVLADPMTTTDQALIQEVIAYLPTKKARTSAVAQAHIQYELQTAHIEACKSACKQTWAQQGALLHQEGPYQTFINTEDGRESVWLYKATRKLDTTSCVSGPVYEKTLQTNLPQWLLVQMHERKTQDGVAKLEETPVTR